MLKMEKVPDSLDVSDQAGDAREMQAALHHFMEQMSMFEKSIE